jgi:hypothetical protein
MTGAVGEIGDVQIKAAKKELAMQENENTPISDGHLHPMEYDANGNITKYGSPDPSGDDKKNLSNYTEPSFILGYTESPGIAPANQIGGTVPNVYTPTIGFYNENGSIISVDFSTLQNAIKKINK